jgi:trigger factor
LLLIFKETWGATQSECCPGGKKTEMEKIMVRFDLKIIKSEREDGKIQLNVTVPAKLTGNVIKSGAFALAMQNQINLKDVAEDEIVATVIEKVGEPQYKAFINYYACNSLAPFAVQEKGLEIIMDPQAETTDEIVEGREFRFVATVTPKPQYELESYEPVKVKITRPVVTDAEIEAQLYALAENFASTVADEGAEVADGQEISIAIETTEVATGEPMRNLTAPKRVYQTGDGFLPAEFDDAIRGMKAGESRSFEWGLPGLEGQEPMPVSSTVTLLQVNKKIIPAITDAWVEAKIPNANNVAELKEMIRKEGEEYKAKELEAQKFFTTASELATRFKGYIADEIYEYTRANMLQGIQASLQQQGIDLKTYIQQQGMDEQQFSMQVMLQVRESLRQGFALDALARHMKLTVNDDDYKDALSRIAPGREDQARKEYEGTGRSYMINEAALRTKANKWLVETATYEYFEQPGA